MEIYLKITFSVTDYFSFLLLGWAKIPEKSRKNLGILDKKYFLWKIFHVQWLLSIVTSYKFIVPIAFEITNIGSKFSLVIYIDIGRD